MGVIIIQLQTKAGCVQGTFFFVSSRRNQIWPCTNEGKLHLRVTCFCFLLHRHTEQPLTRVLHGRQNFLLPSHFLKHPQTESVWCAGRLALNSCFPVLSAYNDVGLEFVEKGSASRAHRPESSVPAHPALSAGTVLAPGVPTHVQQPQVHMGLYSYCH